MKQLPCISLILEPCIDPLSGVSVWLILTPPKNCHNFSHGTAWSIQKLSWVWWPRGKAAYAYWSLVELPRPQEWLLILGMTDGHPHPSAANAARKMLGSPNEESFKMNPSAHPKPMKSFCLGFLGGNNLSFWWVSNLVSKISCSDLEDYMVISPFWSLNHFENPGLVRRWPNLKYRKGG